MCGIVGVAGDVTASRERLLAMRDCLRHRGPDDEGVSWSPDVRVGLAYGTLLERESDLFGPVVNLASRITKIAFPGSLTARV